MYGAFRDVRPAEIPHGGNNMWISARVRWCRCGMSRRVNGPPPRGRHVAVPLSQVRRAAAALLAGIGARWGETASSGIRAILRRASLPRAGYWITVIFNYE